MQPSCDAALHSPVYVSPDISHNKLSNIGINQNEGAGELIFRRDISRLDDQTEMTVTNYVHLKMKPSVFMEYRTKDDMEMFEKTDKKRLLKFETFRVDWARRSLFDPVDEPVVLTCHVQGIDLKNWKLQWLHDGGSKNYLTYFIFFSKTELSRLSQKNYMDDSSFKPY